IVGDADGGGPDTLRMNGGSLYVGDRMFETANKTSVLDLHGGSLTVNDGSDGAGSQLYQAVPLSVDGAGAGPTMTFEGYANSFLNTTTPLSLIVGRSGGGNFNVIGGGLGPIGLPEYFEVQGNAVVADMATGKGVVTATHGGIL